MIKEQSIQEKPSQLSESDELVDEAEVNAAKMVKSRQPYKYALFKLTKTNKTKA